MTEKPRSAGWRAVYFIQGLISRLAPPLHSLHWKILALLLVAIFVPALYFLWQVRLNIELSHLRSTEVGMIDTALVITDVLAAQGSTTGVALSSLPMTRELKRRLFKDLSPDMRIVIYDAQGQVVSDTSGLLSAGTPEAQQEDVQKALGGKYGAHWVRNPSQPGRVVTLYSTLPIFHDQQVIGAVSVIKTTADVRRSIFRSFKDLIAPSLLAFALAVLTSYLLSSYLTKVITDMARRADRIAAGEQGVQLETWTKSELGDLARAVETMRRKLEGKSYVEEMVATFSHELKTPLAAIRGATEIVEDSPDPATREKFLNNIRAEVDRLTRIVTNLLALSRLETQPVAEDAAVGLAEIAEEVAEVYRRRAETLGLRFEAKIEKGQERTAVPEEEVRSILEILLDNAFQFTPRGKGVTLLVSGTVLGVLDEGVGIEADLQPRIFDRFMTTVNPLTGRRGTGLGLAIVQSIALRHHGVVTMKSTPGAGSEFSVKFPESS